MYYDHPHEAVKQEDPCQYIRVTGSGETRVCGAEWTSVLHPPNQYRHWCSSLDEGRDCMHLEEFDDE